MKSFSTKIASINSLAIFRLQKKSLLWNLSLKTSLNFNWPTSFLSLSLFLSFQKVQNGSLSIFLSLFHLEFVACKYSRFLKFLITNFVCKACSTKTPLPLKSETFCRFSFLYLNWIQCFKKSFSPFFPSFSPSMKGDWTSPKSMRYPHQQQAIWQIAWGSFFFCSFVLFLFHFICILFNSILSIHSALSAFCFFRKMKFNHRSNMWLIRWFLLWVITWTELQQVEMLLVSE